MNAVTDRLTENAAKIGNKKMANGDQKLSFTGMIQSLMALSVVALVGVVWNMSGELKVLGVNVSNLQNSFQLVIDDRYRAGDASKDWQLQFHVNEEFESDIADLRGKLTNQ